jgi:hypothetical protein
LPIVAEANESLRRNRAPRLENAQDESPEDGDVREEPNAEDDRPGEDGKRRKASAARAHSLQQGL